MDSTIMRLITALGCLGAVLMSSRTLLHDFQLESYQYHGYFRTVLRNPQQTIFPGAVLTIVACGVGCFVRSGAMALVWAVVVLALGAAMLVMQKRIKMKKPLVFTPRVKRLCVVMTMLDALIIGLLAGLVPGPWYLLVLSCFPLFLPLWIALAGLLAWPMEKLISEMYFRDAQRILREHPDLTRIGITGSYGKTSVKFILGTLLEERYQTLVTPSSFNTPMGVTKVIRSKLLPAHQVFVAEMGARHVGDIREMCRLVHPTLGVLTSVGPQHLDTFKTLERIKHTKYELMEAIPTDGCCFFPDDGGICRELYDQTRKEKRLCSLHPTPEADVWAEDITVSPEGSRFRLCTQEGSIACQTQLLGEHNIQNVLLAATVCLYLHMSLKQIARGISRLEPVEHRLQLIRKPGGLTIIDDAFNSNPRGAQAALKVLADFPGRRIIITPGMVELGEEEMAFNRTFGEKIAHSADVAILVGPKHTQPIAEGLRSEGFPEENLHTVSSLDEAAVALRRIGRAGDTVLFENDLPDNYSE